jgi:ankyrin repeat protein
MEAILAPATADERGAPDGGGGAAAARLANARNRAGSAPLHWAALNGHAGAVRLLLRRGADAAARNAAGRDALFEAEAGGRDGAVAALLAEGGAEPESGVDAGEGEADERDGEGMEEAAA